MANKTEFKHTVQTNQSQTLEISSDHFEGKVRNSLINIEKKGVLLVNLGSPESSTLKDVKKYLNQFLMDGNVIDIPYLLRLLLVRGIIVPTRAKKSAKLYQKIWSKKGSPLIVNSEKLVNKVVKKTSLPLALAMRYGEPSIKTGITELTEKGVEKILVVPLYPQFAMSTTLTVMEEVEKVKSSYFAHVAVNYLPAFYSNNEYIKVLANSIKKGLNSDKPGHLLFSYHGLPERHLRKADPTGNHCLQTKDCCTTPNVAHKTCYKHQCVKTTELVVKELKLKEGTYSNSYQSRLGNDPWIKPYTSDTVKFMAANGKKNLSVVTPAFVSDCLETIEEIGMEAKEDFLDNGGKSFTRIDCLNDDEEWAEIIAGWIKKDALFEKTY